MKKKLLTLASVLFVTIGSYGQAVTDTIRTKGDKPGTPKSLRTTDQSPQSKTTIINNNGPDVNKASNQTIITTNNPSGNTVPTTPITLQTKPVNNRDTFPATPVNNKVSNVTNPIRK